MAADKFTREETKSVVTSLKRISIVLSLGLFVLFVYLAADHVYGVTASAKSSGSSANNSTPSQSSSSSNFFNSGSANFGSGNFNAPATQSGLS